VRSILLTSIGGRVGDDVITLLQPLRDRLRIVGTNSDAGTIHNFRCDRSYLVPPTRAEAEWMTVMRRILRTEQPDLVLPLRDGDLAPLAQLKAEPEFSRTIFHCADAAALPAINDKAETAAFARRHGLVFADTADSPAALAGLIARRGFPLIAKPRAGTGSHGVRLVRTPEEATAAIALPGYILQEFIDPPASAATVGLDLSAGIPFFYAMPDRAHHSALAAIAPDGAVRYVGALSVVLTTVETGRSTLDDGPEMEGIVAGWGRALAGIGARGVVNVQGRRDPARGFVPFEINGRVPGGALTRRNFGQDALAGALSAVFGHDPLVYPGPAAPGARSDRFQQAVLVEPADVARLEAEGVWSRPQ